MKTVAKCYLNSISIILKTKIPLLKRAALSEARHGRYTSLVIHGGWWNIVSFSLKCVILLQSIWCCFICARVYINTRAAHEDSTQFFSAREDCRARSLSCAVALLENQLRDDHTDEQRIFYITDFAQFSVWAAAQLTSIIRFAWGLTYRAVWFMWKG